MDAEFKTTSVPFQEARRGGEGFKPLDLGSGIVYSSSDTIRALNGGEKHTIEPRSSQPEVLSLSKPAMGSNGASNALTSQNIERISRVGQSTEPGQTSQGSVEAGINNISNTHSSHRTGGRRGRGPLRSVSPQASGSITLQRPGAPQPTIVPTTGRSQSTPRHTTRGGAVHSSARGSYSGTVAGTKRKRAADLDDLETRCNSSSSSEEVTTLPSQSRSGRKIIQAATIGPPVKAEHSDSQLQLSPLQKRTTTTTLPSLAPSSATKPSKGNKKISKRTHVSSAVCRNCGRGHSPASNAIVFCDGCNTPWHQHCHDPPIKQEYLSHVDKDWFCGDCIMLREHSTVLEGKVAGTAMSMVEKRKYLKTLPPSALISLLLHATSLYPSLPIFPPKAPVLSVDAATLDQHAELYEEVVEELPYPKAGHGIQMRPESEYVAILIDGNSAVYSHRWSGIGEMMAAAGWPERAAGGVRTANSGGQSVRAGA